MPSLFNPSSNFSGRTKDSSFSLCKIVFARENNRSSSAEPGSRASNKAAVPYALPSGYRAGRTRGKTSSYKPAWCSISLRKVCFRCRSFVPAAFQEAGGIFRLGSPYIPQHAEFFRVGGITRPRYPAGRLKAPSRGSGEAAIVLPGRRFSCSIFQRGTDFRLK